MIGAGHNQVGAGRCQLVVQTLILRGEHSDESVDRGVIAEPSPISVGGISTEDLRRPPLRAGKCDLPVAAND